MNIDSYIKELATLNRNIDDGTNVMDRLVEYRDRIQKLALEKSGSIMESLDTDCSDDHLVELKEKYFNSSILEELLEVSSKILTRQAETKEFQQSKSPNFSYDKSDMVRLNNTLKELSHYSIDRLKKELASQLGVRKPTCKLTIVFNYPNNKTADNVNMIQFKKIVSKYSYNQEILFKKCTKGGAYKVIIKYKSDRIVIEKDFEKQIESYLSKHSEINLKKPRLLELVLVSNDKNCVHCRNFRPEWNALIKSNLNTKIKYHNYDLESHTLSDIEDILKQKTNGVPALYGKYGNKYQEIMLRGEKLEQFIASSSKNSLS